MRERDKAIISINGKIVIPSEATLSIYDLSINRGYAVFDYLRIREYKPVFLKDHLKRFYNSIEKANIPLRLSKKELERHIYALVDQANISEGYVRMTLTAGEADDFFNANSTSNLIIVVDQFRIPESSNYTHGAKLLFKKYKRSLPQIKSSNYFFVQKHRDEMIAKGAIDILYYDKLIRETSRANIFLVTAGKLYTPKSKILKGITRKKVLELFPDTTIEDIPREKILEYDEIFITSSSKEILPIVQIDEAIIGDGTIGVITKEVMSRFSKFVLHNE